MDEKKIKEAVRLFLEGIGEDPDREGLQETPERIVRMCGEVYGGLQEEAGEHLCKTFSSDNNQMVIEKDITFYSMCEHHLVPFFGRVSLVYKPRNGMVAGLSKFVKLVELLSHRPQLQERLTEQIVQAVYEDLQAEGVLAISEAQQLCMTMRGDMAQGTSTLASACRGCFEGDKDMYNQAWQLLGWNRNE